MTVNLVLTAPRTDDDPPTERTLAVVEIEGDTPEHPVTLATLLRSEGTFWVERMLGKRMPHGTFEGAMSELEQMALAYDGKVRAR